MDKKILIVGAGGYIGTEMVTTFLKKDYEIIALDRFYFGNTLEHLKQHKNLRIIKDDINNIDKNILKNVDVIINLASISNDPASELQPEITHKINYEGAIKLAQLAKEMHIKKYIFASSCSVYGAGKDIVDELSETAPISVYAKSKITAEKELLKIADATFCITILRMATIYGLSKRRMRFDLIVNLMTLHAWKNKKIFIMGGGKQWRPLVHVADAIEAFDLILLEKSKKKINKEIFNVGSNIQNFQVSQVANLFKKHFPDVVIETAPDDPDKRSYQVNFNKIKKVLGYKTKKTIDDGIKEIKEALENGEVTDDIRTNTSWYYRYLIDADKLLSEVKIKEKLFL